MNLSLSYVAFPFLRPVLKWSLAAVLTLCAVCPVLGKEKEDGKEKKGTWNGDFSLSAGSNFTKPKTEDVGEHYSKYFSRTSAELFAALGWSGEKFSIEGKLDASSFVYLTGGMGVTVEGDKNIESIDDVTKAYGDISVKETNASTYNGSVSASWKINPKNLLDFYYQLGYVRDFPTKGVITCDVLLDSLENYKYGFTAEDIHDSKLINRGGLNYRHSFDKTGREFQATVDVKFQKNVRSTIWNLGDGDMQSSEISKVYRETPVYHDNELISNIRYTDCDFLDTKGLDLEFILDLKSIGDLDRLSAANLINGVWVDSTSYRENFDFFSFAPRPGVGIEYSSGIFKIGARYQPEWYIYRLSGDNIGGQTATGTVAHYADFRTSVSPGKYHKISFNFSRDMTRPDYIQICWFDRAGQYANEIIRGNPDLKPSTCTKSSLVYDFKYRRFRAAFDLGYKYEFNKIESTFTTEEWEDGTYRINTWINSSKSATANAELTLAWEGVKLKAEIGGKYSYYVGWKDSGTETRDSDYSLRGNVSYILKTWKFDARLRYQSAIIRNYSSMTDLLGCDVRIEKKFKRFGIFVEGRDLFDKAVEKLTISDDETQKRLEVTNDNKRIFLLGLRYTF